MKMQGSILWKNRLQRNNITNLNSKKTQPVPRRAVPPDDLEFNFNQKPKNTASSCVKYTTVNELASASYDEELKNNIKLILNKLQNMEDKLAIIEDKMHSLCSGDVLFDNDLKLTSDLRKDNCEGDLCFIEKSVTNNYVPVTEGKECSEDYSIYDHVDIEVYIVFNKVDLEYIIIYPFGKQKTDLCNLPFKETFKQAVTTKKGDKTLIFKQSVTNDILKWEVIGYVDEIGLDEITQDIATDKFTCLCFKENLSFFLKS